MISAMMYAELSSRLPMSGSAFAYTYATMGELPAWMIGWHLNLKYLGIVCGLTRGMSSYFNGLLIKLGATVPDWMLGINAAG